MKETDTINVKPPTSYIPNNGNLPLPSRSQLHRKYGGQVFKSDIEIGYYLSPSYFAQRIERDFQFDNQCRKNIISRKREITNA